MLKQKSIWVILGVVIPLILGSVLVGCMKSSEDGGHINSSTEELKDGITLDALHGGARIVLPEIDFATLNKQAANSLAFDTLPQAWLEIIISGDRMSEMVFQFPLRRNGALVFDIKGIPVGNKRSFHGRLLIRGGQVTHEGTTIADIKGGIFSDIHLYLAKAMGGANVCIVIEGQKLPACALDSLPPAPPPPDSQVISRCWYIGADSVSGHLYLNDDAASGQRGFLKTFTGFKFPVTAWYHRGDSLFVSLNDVNGDKIWRIQGQVKMGGYLWEGLVFRSNFSGQYPFYGKPIPCEVDTVVIPPIDTVRPPKDTSSGGTIPRLTSSEGEVTRCFEMRLNYASKCELSGYAKMNFMAGKITVGYIVVGDKPSRTYTQVHGSYNDGGIQIESFIPGTEKSTPDSVQYKGVISIQRTMAKGDYMRLPLGSKGIWTMTSRACGIWIPTYPDSSCFTSPKSSR